MVDDTCELLQVASKNVENALVYQQEQHQLARDAVNDAYSVFSKALEDRRAEALRELSVIFTDKQVYTMRSVSDLNSGGPVG